MGCITSLFRKKGTEGDFYIKLEDQGESKCKNYEDTKECNIPEEEELYHILNSYNYEFNNIIQDNCNLKEYSKFFESISILERLCVHYSVCSKDDKEKRAYCLDTRDKWYSINKKSFENFTRKMILDNESMNQSRERMLDFFIKDLREQKEKSLREYTSSKDFQDKVNIELMNRLNSPSGIIDDNRNNNSNNNNSGGDIGLLMDI